MSYHLLVHHLMKFCAVLCCSTELRFSDSVLPATTAFWTGWSFTKRLRRSCASKRISLSPYLRFCSQWLSCLLDCHLVQLLLF